jgi:hypothetical protein
LTKLYSKIIDIENIKDAYLEVYESFLEKSKVFDYDVIDSQQIHHTELDLVNFLGQVQQELKAGVKPRLARSVAIPKKNGKIRKIYMVPIKERVKCQAIYRVLQEYLKPTYSKFLYSFRSERPSYFALRSLRRFYLANVRGGVRSGREKPTYFLLKTDFKDYSDHINKTILLNKLSAMGVDSETLALVQQFVEMPFVRGGEWMSMAEGTMQGIPLVSLFNNIYMSQIDEVVGAQVEFYRRVGDDVIALDCDKEKLEKALVFIRQECKNMRIILNEDKTALQLMAEKFEYLGLAFEAGRVFIPESKVTKMIDQMKLLFPAHSMAGNLTKIRRMKRVMVINASGQSALWGNYIKSLNLLTDMQQLQRVSLKMMTVLWAYLGQGFTAKKMAQGRHLLQASGLNLMSFFDHFKQMLWPHQKKRRHQR